MNMFKQAIKTRQGFATQFLESALSPGREKLANSYLLTGSNMLDMYFLAAETARILNCEKKMENCNCTNCEWIRQNRHPAMVTVSPVDYIHANNDGKAKTVVTINQARHLKQALSVSSRYHRVVIFTGAAEGKEYEAQAGLLWEGFREYISPPKLEGSDSERDSWIPMPLNYKTFHSEPANALLKIIEEPPPNVTFFFLARDREDMIDTIVSRSQIIPLAYNPEKPQKTELLDKFFEVFPPANKEVAVKYSERLMEIAKENSITVENLLDMVQERLIYQVRQNCDDTDFCKKNIERLKSLQRAKTELKSYINPQAVMDSLLIDVV